MNEDYVTQKALLAKLDKGVLQLAEEIRIPKSGANPFRSMQGSDF